MGLKACKSSFDRAGKTEREVVPTDRKKNYHIVTNKSSADSEAFNVLGFFIMSLGISKSKKAISWVQLQLLLMLAILSLVEGPFINILCW